MAIRVGTKRKIQVCYSCYFFWALSTLEIIATDPSQAAEQLRNFATHLSGFTASFKVSAGEEGTPSAQIIMRIPAEHFDDTRAQVRTIAKAVEQDTVEARDVTREDVNQEASLRNSRAEEAQYLDRCGPRVMRQLQLAGHLRLRRPACLRDGPRPFAPAVWQGKMAGCFAVATSMWAPTRWTTTRWPAPKRCRDVRCANSRISAT